MESHHTRKVPNGIPTGSTQIISTMRADSNLLQSHLNSELSLAGESCPFYLFLYHRDRMFQAASEFDWPEAVKVISGPEGASRILDTLSQHLAEKVEDPVSLSQPIRVRQTFLVSVDAQA